MKVKASALQRLAAEGGLIEQIIANTLAKNIRAEMPVKGYVDTWFIIDDCCEGIIQKLLEEKKIYRSEVK